GRVVVLDELLGRGERPPLVLLLGKDLGPELARRGQGQPLVLVVVDDDVADLADEVLRRILELLQEPGLAPLAALLDLESEVVQALGRSLVVIALYALGLP